MKVLIVAKTRQGSGACIGGITFDGRSVRLIPLVGDVHDGANLEYSVGDVWEVDAMPAVDVTPPHVENVIVRSKRRMGPMTDLPAFVERHMPPKAGGPELLYEGLVQASPAARCTSPSGPECRLTVPCSGGRTSRWNGSTPARTCAIAIPLLMADARSCSSVCTSRPTSSRPARWCASPLPIGGGARSILTKSFAVSSSYRATSYPPKPAPPCAATTPNHRLPSSPSSRLPPPLSALRSTPDPSSPVLKIGEGEARSEPHSPLPAPRSPLPHPPRPPPPSSSPFSATTPSGRCRPRSSTTC